MNVREIQKKLRQQCIDIQNEVDETGSGPGNFILVDPDGNPILIDQYV